MRVSQQIIVEGTERARLLDVEADGDDGDFVSVQWTPDIQILGEREDVRSILEQSLIALSTAP